MLSRLQDIYLVFFFLSWIEERKWKKKGIGRRKKESKRKGKHQEKERNSENIEERKKEKLLEKKKKKKIKSSVQKEVWWLLCLIFWFWVFVYLNLYDSMILRKAFRCYRLLLFINWALWDFHVLQRL